MCSNIDVVCKCRPLSPSILNVISYLIFCDKMRKGGSYSKICDKLGKEKGKDMKLLLEG